MYAQRDVHTKSSKIKKQQSQSKQNNINSTKQYTVRIHTTIQRPTSAGADSIGMGSKNSQIKTQKKELKPNNLRSSNQTTQLTMLMRRSTSLITRDYS
jgi:hypothetical protein